MLVKWVNCPICGGTDMPKEIDENLSKIEGTEIGYIRCSNLDCGSNGGNNFDALKKNKEKS